MKDIHQMTTDALATKLEATRESLRSFRFTLSGAKTKNIREGKAHKKAVAQLLTELRMRTK
ncbi:50S ribosomal protein L29 [Candidatus Nomurabacteria bacterium]|jgi:ribosomal protein L29|nr:MAG: 50S ribosomal protein L29 [Candidatus Nomurabacteria bacterium]